jgi:hypothetical protein
LPSSIIRSPSSSPTRDSGPGTPDSDSSPPPPSSILLINAEDDPADTIRPRLEAAGANLDRIHLLNAVKEKDRQYVWTMDRLRHLHHALLENRDIQLVILDPVAAFCRAGGGLGESSLRDLFLPLARLTSCISQA